MNEEMLRREGLARINQPEHDTPLIPLTPWHDFPLRFSVEYPVSDFPAEVGFWAKGFGLDFLILDDTYAVCTDPDRQFTFSFQQRPVETDLSALRIQWFTDALDKVIAVLDARDVPYQIYYQSSIQRYVRTQTPAGVTVEVWSGDEGHCP